MRLDCAAGCCTTRYWRGVGVAHPQPAIPQGAEELETTQLCSLGRRCDGPSVVMPVFMCPPRTCTYCPSTTRSSRLLCGLPTRSTGAWGGGTSSALSVLSVCPPPPLPPLIPCLTSVWLRLCAPPSLWHRYFKRIDVPMLRREAVPLHPMFMSYDHSMNTLVIQVRACASLLLRGRQYHCSPPLRPLLRSWALFVPAVGDFMPVHTNL
jgi:hypothetical protein